MRVIKSNLWISAWVFLAITSCSTSKFLKENEVLYSGVDIAFSNPEEIDQHKDLKAAVQAELFPKPADKFLGLWYTKQWLYSTIKVKDGKTKGLKYKLKYKFGEKPTLLSDVNTSLMNNINIKTLQDNGFFQCKSSNEIIVEKKKGKIKYLIQNQEASTIDSIIFPNTRSEIDSLIATYKYLRAKVGKRYSLDDLIADRQNLAEYVRDAGYYEFDQKDLFYLLDTAGRSPSFNLYFKVKAPKGDSVHRKFYIRNIDIYVTESIDLEKDTSSLYSFTYKGLRVHQDFAYISRKTLFSNTLIENDHRFSVEGYKYTSGRFINLDIFNFVNINYKKVEENKLDVTIILNPSQHQSIQASIEANTSNRSFLGGSLNAKYTNKNISNRADKLTYSGSFGSELQQSKSDLQLSILNYGLEAKYEIPRLLFFLEKGKLKSESAPTSFLSANYNHQQWLGFYNLNSAELGFGYNWTNASRFHHDIKPLSFNLIDVSNVSKDFAKTLSENPSLASSFEDIIIFGSQYRLSFNTKRTVDQKGYFFVQNYFELAGQNMQLFNSIFNKYKPEPYTIFKIPYSQFLKNEIELRYHKDFSKRSSFVSRVELGAGIAMGNSQHLPFTKKFFAGGPNTIRGFRFRSLGPGNYSYEDVDGRINPIQQSGDIKLLFNTEYRFTIYDMLKGALFIDAGNVWLTKYDEDRPTGVFEVHRFYKQLAVSSGFGIRFDMGFFVLRGDFGIPIHKPYEAVGKRWITEYKATGFSEWADDNLIFNVAIGYPF